ncbi:uncharacterized protein LOC144881350 [Branchiostoma floridae x Branchiostoma japonicum]
MKPKALHLSYMDSRLAETSESCRLDRLERNSSCVEEAARFLSSFSTVCCSWLTPFAPFRTHSTHDFSLWKSQRCTLDSEEGNKRTNRIYHSSAVSPGNTSARAFISAREKSTMKWLGVQEEFQSLNTCSASSISSAASFVMIKKPTTA